LAYCDAMRPKPVGVTSFFDFVTDLRVGLDAAGIKDGNLVVLGNDLFRNDEFGERLDVAVSLVNFDAQLPRRADRLFGGGQQRLLNRADEDITIDALFRAPKIPELPKNPHSYARRCVRIRRTKKSADMHLPTFARWMTQQTLPFLRIA